MAPASPARACGVSPLPRPSTSTASRLGSPSGEACGVFLDRRAAAAVFHGRDGAELSGEARRPAPRSGGRRRPGSAAAGSATIVHAGARPPASARHGSSLAGASARRAAPSRRRGCRRTTTRCFVVSPRCCGSTPTPPADRRNSARLRPSTDPEVGGLKPTPEDNEDRLASVHGDHGSLGSGTLSSQPAKPVREPCHIPPSGRS